MINQLFKDISFGAFNRILKLKRILIFVLILHVFSFPLVKSNAQTTIYQQQTIEELIEDIASNSDQEIDFTNLYEDLSDIMKNPINLNTATRKDLERLQFLNDIQIDGLLKYISQYGNMLTIFELQLVDGFQKDDINRLLPFVIVGPIEEKNSISVKKALKYGQNELFLRTQFIIEKQKGYYPANDSLIQANPNNYYLGDRTKEYARYRFHFKDKIYFGFTAEKDPGEEFFKGSQQKGFDFYSAHLQVNELGFLKTLVVGDYQTQFGQGLMMWTGWFVNRSSSSTSIIRHPLGIKKYTSSDASRFMRGIASTIAINKFDLTAFYSRKKIDANIVIDSLNGIKSVKSIVTSGLHTLPKELQSEKTLTEFIYGGNLAYTGNNCKLGFTSILTKFSFPLQKDDLPYNQYDIKGSHTINMGMNYYWHFKRIHFYGEGATSGSGGLSFVNGAVFNTVSNISLSIIHKHTGETYQSYNKSQSSSSVSSEDELYVGTEFYPYQTIKISAYADTYKWNWLKYRTDQPSNGVNYFAQLNFAPDSKLNMYIRYSERNKDENLSSEDVNLSFISATKKQSIRYDLSFIPLISLSLSNRIELTYYKKEGQGNENGFLAYQDIDYSFRKLPLKVNFRYIIFDSPFNARIYAYEKDILYGASTPAYQGKGNRVYLNVHWSVSKNIDFWIKYGITIYSDKEKINEGSLNEINGNKKSEIKFQIRIKI